jgi:hypothetical protein
MTLEQENDAIQKKLDKVTKELEKVKKEAAREIGNFDDTDDHKAILKAIVGKEKQLLPPDYLHRRARGGRVPTSVMPQMSARSQGRSLRRLHRPRL